MGTACEEGYSSEVEIYLLVAGEKLPVAKVGPHSLIYRGEPELPPSTDALLVIEIDGQQEQHLIVLYAGAKNNSEPVGFF